MKHSLLARKLALAAARAPRAENATVMLAASAALADLGDRPAAYVVKQDGYSYYTEIHRTKQDAREAARDMLWLHERVVITPLYPGKSVGAL